MSRQLKHETSAAGVLPVVVLVAAVAPGDLAGDQPITDRVFETISGIIGQVVVKVRGDDLEQLTQLAEQVKGRLSKVDGVADLALYQAGSVPQLGVQLDRDRLAERGISVSEAQDVVEVALGGKVATEVWEGERRYGVAIGTSGAGGQPPSSWRFLPFATVAAIAGLHLAGENFSVSAAVGSITLLGQVTLAGVRYCPCSTGRRRSKSWRRMPRTSRHPRPPPSWPSPARAWRHSSWPSPHRTSFTHRCKTPRDTAAGVTPQPEPTRARPPAQTPARRARNQPLDRIASRPTRPTASRRCSIAGCGRAVRSPLGARRLARLASTVARRSRRAALAQADLFRKEARPIPRVIVGSYVTRDVNSVSALAVPLPVFDRNQGAIGRAESEARGHQSLLEALETRARAEVRGAVAALDHARRARARFLESGVLVTTDLLERAWRAYEAGNFSIAEALDAYNAVWDARRELLELERTVAEAEARLARAIALQAR